MLLEFSQSKLKIKAAMSLARLSQKIYKMAQIKYNLRHLKTSQNLLSKKKSPITNLSYNPSKN